jgi:hypothetical protein
VMIREPDGVARPSGLRLASKPSAGTNKRKDVPVDGVDDDTTLRYTGKVSATSYIARRAALVDGLSVRDAVETSFTDDGGQRKKYRRYGHNDACMRASAPCMHAARVCAPRVYARHACAARLCAPRVRAAHVRACVCACAWMLPSPVARVCPQSSVEWSMSMSGRPIDPWACE